MKKKDIRYYRTRKNIISAMTRLLRKNYFEQITVTTICEEAQISRSGFYLHYLDKYDFVESYLKEFIDYANEVFQKQKQKDIGAFLLYMLTHLKNEEELLSLLLSKHGSVEIQDKIKQIMRENARKNILPYLTLTLQDETEERYTLAFLSNALLGTFQEWINSGQKETPEQMMQIIRRLIGYDFKKI